MSSIKVAKRVLTIESEAIRDLIDRINEKFNKAVEILFNCKGRVILAGMGKSGFIGRKISATLASTGTPSLYVHPAEAIHGDLGMIIKDDVVIAISNSGETEEITRLVPLIKKIGAKLIVFTGNQDSTLAKYSDVVLDVYVKQEACTLGLVPTSSTTVSLAMGDALAVALLEKKDFKIEDYAFYHPGGSLGKKMLLMVEEVMRRGEDNPVVEETRVLKDVLLKITESKAGAAIVVDAKGKVSGIFTDGDLRRSIDSIHEKMVLPISKVMTRNPISICRGCLATEALRIIKEKKIDELPVVDENNFPIGIIDEKDLLGIA